MLSLQELETPLANYEEDDAGCSQRSWLLSVSPLFNDWVLALLVIGLSMVKPELGNLSSFTIRYLVFLLRMFLSSI